MILHLGDWLKYPTARPDWTTRNRSFVNLVALYHRMGVKNCHFILALVNQDLVGVDPHDPNLTRGQKEAIMIECTINPWYFLREVVRIKKGMYIANRGNIALMWLFLNHIDLFLIQPRQTGKSVGADILMLWLLYFGCRDTTIQLITKDASLRTDNMNRIKAFRDSLPAYLTPRHPKDPDNTEEVQVNARSMFFKGKVPRASITDADKVGRGATSEILQFDEVPYINHIGVTLPAALGSSTAQRELAKERGTPYGILYTTTAGKIDSRDGSYVYDILKSAAPWTEMFFDAGNQLRLKEIVMANSTGDAPLVDCTFSHRQLGYTDEWLWETMALNKSRGDAAERDYLNRWTNGTGTNPLSTAILKTIADSEREPDHTEFFDGGYCVRWYVPKDRIESFMAGSNFIIGLDTSDAIGRDAISMVMIDVRTRGVVAAGKFNKTSIWRWTSFMANFLIKYPTTLLVPERKSSAQSIVDGIVQILDAEGINPFERIFNQIVNQKERYEKQYGELHNPTARRRLYETHKETFGFNTTADSRTLLYVDIMQGSLEEAAAYVRDKSLSGEFRGLMVKNDRIDHSAGGHDDTIIAYLLANWLLTHAKHLDYYGINYRDVRSDVRPNGGTATVQETMAMQKQRQLKEEIERLVEAYTKAEFDFDAKRIENRMRFLMSKVEGQREVYDSIAELFEKANAKRNESVRNKRSFSSSSDAYPNIYGNRWAA